MGKPIVLEDGPFCITWNEGRTLNVFALDREVNVFSMDYGGPTPTLKEATAYAAEWWADGGKEATQETIRRTS